MNFLPFFFIRTWRPQKSVPHNYSFQKTAFSKEYRTSIFSFRCWKNSFGDSFQRLWRTNQRGGML